MVLWAIGANISESQVERDQGTGLCPADLRNPGIGLPPEALAKDAQGVMPGGPEHLCELHGQVLIDLEPQPAALPEVSTTRSRASSAA